MRTLDPLGWTAFTSSPGYLCRTGCRIALLGTVSLAALAQSPAPQAETQSPPVPTVSTQSKATAGSADADSSTSAATNATESPRPKDPVLTAGAFSVQTKAGELDEDQLKQLLMGKTLYLRAGYLDNNLEFDERGRLTGHSPRGSFTLSQIQINKVRLSKRELKLEGDRYALHFLGAAPYEDPTKATDRVKITPKKKVVRISFLREQVEKPKKEKHKRKHKDSDAAAGNDSDHPLSASEASASTAKPDQPAEFQTSSGDKRSRTTDPAHASQLLLAALDNVFSRGIDARMIDAMPDFWKLYYKSAAEKADFKPRDPGVQYQGTVDQKARLLSALDPPSNEFAQANGVAGMALYHAVVGSDGKVEEVVAGRPIGFGLDENAEQTIRKATFQPAMKNGKPVPVALDLVVSFRIYSKRTSQPDADTHPSQESQAKLPGPYTLQDLEQAEAAQQNQPGSPNQPGQSTKAPQ